MTIRKFFNPMLNSTLLIIFLIVGIVSCKKYLEVSPNTQGLNLTGNYYQDSAQIYAALIATYSPVRINTSGFYGQNISMNCAADDHYAGGGGATDGNTLQNLTNWTVNATNMGDNSSGCAYIWYNYYIGINNANILISKIDAANIPATTKKLITAESKMLRAYYYFNLIRIWGNIPLLLNTLTSSSIYSVKQATIDEVYAQIEKDLSEAITDLPKTLSEANAGRVNQGAAKALLGKVYLYEGDGVPAKNIAGKPAKYALAATMLSEVNGTLAGSTFTSPYNYQLLTSYNNLWSNKVSNASPVFGNSPGRFNSEAVFEDVHTNQGQTGWGNWSNGTDMGNRMNTMVGPRSYQKKTNNVPDFSTAGNWSFSVITEEAYNFMVSNTTGADTRTASTIFNAKDLQDKGDIAYVAGNANTGYFLYKYIPLKSDETTLGGEIALNFQQSGYIIRLADCYLMEAEALLKSGGDATRALALVNAVRNRAGANPLTILTIDDIKKERRMEFMGEGHRFFDLVRWGDAGKNAELLRRGFTTGKNEWFPIPYKEMQNQNFKQNSGY